MSQVGSYTFGIIVDKIYDAEEIVVKPVSALLRNISIFAGNTILGDGSVIMILDPNGIATTTGEIQVGDDMTEVRDQRSFAVTVAVAHVVLPVDDSTVVHQPIREVGVAGGVLRIAVHDDDDVGAVTLARPALVVDRSGGPVERRHGRLSSSHELLGGTNA